MKTPSIVIANRADEAPKIDEEQLRQWAEESDNETSNRMQMLAVVLLALAVASFFLLLGGIGLLVRHLER